MNKHKDNKHNGDGAEGEELVETQTIESLQTELATAQAALAEANDKMLRFRAEADNARRRSVLDVENAHKYSIEKIARELLSVVDSLEKGLESVSDNEPEQESIEHMRKGMELTHKLLLNLLEKFNIHQISPAVGEAFDPKKHEALTTQVTNDMEANMILTVVQKGFLIHDRILRPARVIVSKTS